MNRRLLLLLISVLAWLVPEAKGQLVIKDQHEVGCTNVKNQENTGTCWSFATCSFLESELIRQDKLDHDLSEMFIVRNIYLDKARNYVLRQGKAQFSQGSLSHDVIRAASMYGLMPENVYSGRLEPEVSHDHGEMVAVLKGYLDGLIGRPKLSDHWLEGVEAILDVYLGRPPETFSMQDDIHRPNSYAIRLGVRPQDYVQFTSFTHHPYYISVILEIPDNYSNGSYINVPIDELETIARDAILSGYSVAWDGDVSEEGFSSSDGLALWKDETGIENMMDAQEQRQALFESLQTTDDHLMHIVGIGADQYGETYFKIKNSWGDRGPYHGYLYMSSEYFKMKTVSIMIHQEAIPHKTRSRIP